MAIIIGLEKESDEDLIGPFGLVALENSTPGKVDFEISLDQSVLGPNADVHKFGFMSDYSGALLVVDDPAYSVTPSDKLPALGNLKWDWVVTLGNGQPIVNPATFTLWGDTSFTVESILAASPLTIDGNPALVAVHAQSTATDAGSETIYGSQAGSVAEPASLFIFLLMAVIAAGLFFRSKLAT